MLCVTNKSFKITEGTSQCAKENATKGHAKSPDQVPVNDTKDGSDAFRPTTPGHSPGVGH